MDDDVFGARWRRKIAFVADANDLLAETERKQNFRGGKDSTQETSRRAQ